MSSTFFVTQTLASDLVSRIISPILFEVGIPNLVCGCIWRCQSVAYYFWVTEASDFTSDSVKTLFQNMVHL